MNQDLKQSAIHSWHESHHAKMVPFAGWHMPLAYALGAIQEHHATRRSAGLFDISHMGRLLVSGEGARKALDGLLTCDLLSLEPGRSTYGLVCKPDGGILDDIFVFCVSGDSDPRFVVVVNAVNRAKLVAWLGSRLGASVSLIDRTEETSMFALQGPKAVEVAAVVSGFDATALPRFGVVERVVGPSRWQISRTGYTGEDGVEIVIPAVDSLAVWTAFVEHSVVTPVGLAARDSLRFEPGFPLYGHEIDETRTAVESRLTWACHLERDFVGRDAIVAKKAEGLHRRLVTFQMTERGVPRQGCRVVDTAGQDIGLVVTGLFAPTIDVLAGNAFVDLEYSRIGCTIGVEIRGRTVAAEVVKRPLYRPAYRE